MKQEDKDLLLKDLCSRQPYGVKINCFGIPKKLLSISIDDDFITLEVSGGHFYYPFSNELHNECLPYFRSIKSMTEEEILELYKIAYDTWYCDSLYYKNEEFITFRDSIQNNTLCFKNSIWLSAINKVIDWLNEHHFDYNGLIPKGLALPAPEGMYNFNKEE